MSDHEEAFEETEELPRRPRRRLLGAGANRLALALLGVLLIACGFIGGVLVEKGQSSSSSSPAAGASSFASRLSALRGSASSARAGSGGTGGSAASLFGGAGGGARPTAGTVAYLDGSTLYLTTSEGNTIKVNTSAATSVTRTVQAKVSSIHPGETVTVTGASASNGSVSAESISVGSGGGLAALFGGLAGGGASRAARSSGEGGEPSLFGKGG